MDQTIEIEAELLQEVLNKLGERKDEVEKELNGYGDGPKGMNEVFQLCRGFERAFKNAITSTQVAYEIKDSFVSIKGLAGSLANLPLDKKFRLDYLKQVCREADGYQPYLISPEKGLRRVIGEAVDLCLEPVQVCVQTVHQLLMHAAREAAGKASSAANDIDITYSAKLPGFENLVLSATQKALEEWKEDALRVARMLVHMEGDYITAAFFKKRLVERAIAAGLNAQTSTQDEDDGFEEPDDDGDKGTDDEDDKSDAGSVVSDDGESATVANSGTYLDNSDPALLKMGWLEKRIGETSGRKSVPLGSWKWQRRWFVLSEAQGMLYYFKSADDPPNYRGLINIKDCLVEDLDSQGNPKPPTARIDTSSLLFRVSHKDPNKTIVKKHHAVVLRAESPGDKADWITRMRRAAEGGSSGGASKPKASATFKKSPTTTTRETAEPLTPTYTPKNDDDLLRGIGVIVHFNESSQRLTPIPTWSPDEVQAGREFDAYLEKLASDSLEYTRTICDTVALEVPKAVVFCQVKRAQDTLLERLYSHLSALGPTQLAVLLDEGSDTSGKRAACKQAVNDLYDAQHLVKNLQEERAGVPAAQRNPGVDVPGSILELSGLWYLFGNTPVQHGKLYGNFTPAALSRPVAGVPRGPPPRPGGAPPSRPPPVENGYHDNGSAAPGGIAGPSPRPRRRPPPAPPGGAPAPF